MCISMVWIKYATKKAGRDAINKICEEIIGFKHEAMPHTKTSDRSTKGITTMFNHDEDLCDMRDFDKIGKSRIRDLITKRNKVQHF